MAPQQCDLGSESPFRAYFPSWNSIAGSCLDFLRNGDRLLDALRSWLGLCSWLLREFRCGWVGSRLPISVPEASGGWYSHTVLSRPRLKVYGPDGSFV